MTDKRPTPDSIFDDGEDVPLPALAQERGRQFGCLRVLDVRDAASAQPGKYLVKRLLYANQLCVVYGEPASGKSFFISHLAYAIAQGREVFDCRISQADVLYLSLEGGNGFEQRINGLVKQFGACDRFHFVAEPVDFLQQANAAQSVIDAVRHYSAKLVVIDTLARAMGAADENGSQDMGHLILLMDKIRAATGATIVLVHHTPKSGPATPRGHSSLMGAADFMLKVVRDATSDARQATVVKAKDGEEGLVVGFSLSQVELGVDSDGDMITTCIVEPSNVIVKTRDNKLTREEQGILTDIHDIVADPAIAQHVRPREDGPIVLVVSRDAVRDAVRRAGRFHAEPGVALSPAERQMFGRRLTALKDKGAICMTERWIWLPDQT